MTKGSSWGVEGVSLSPLQGLQRLEGELFRKYLAKFKYKNFRKGNYKRTMSEVNYLCQLVLSPTVTIVTPPSLFLFLFSLYLMY